MLPGEAVVPAPRTAIYTDSTDSCSVDSAEITDAQFRACRNTLTDCRQLQNFLIHRFLLGFTEEWPFDVRYLRSFCHRTRASTGIHRHQGGVGQTFG